MNYIVLDLEWNQAMSSDSSVFKKLPIHLRGEIIEIGAVKLNPDMTPGDEFTIDVRPQFFRRIHYKVKKITGFDKDRLAQGIPFPEALEQFHDWCGSDVTFLTWGMDDQGRRFTLCRPLDKLSSDLFLPPWSISPLSRPG